MEIVGRKMHLPLKVQGNLVMFVIYKLPIRVGVQVGTTIYGKGYFGSDVGASNPQQGDT